MWRFQVYGVHDEEKKQETDEDKKSQEKNNKETISAINGSHTPLAYKDIGSGWPSVDVVTSASDDKDINDSDPTSSLQLFLSFTAALGNVRYSRWPRVVSFLGGFFWISCLGLNFAFDCYGAKRSYGYTWVTAQIVNFLSFLVYTLYIHFRTIPWLASGFEELQESDIYKGTQQRVVKATKILPVAALIFGCICAGLQHGLLILDKANHFDFGGKLDPVGVGFLNFLRFTSGFYVYFAYGIFWNLPVVIMLMTGYSMKDYMESMGHRFRSTIEMPTFKEAIQSYSDRAKYVKNSSASCMVSLALLMITSILSLGLNSYIFFFQKRNYLYIFHGLLPIILMVYPISTAAWVTKQYNWFIIVVVKAWIQRNDSDSEMTSHESLDEEEPQKVRKWQTRKGYRRSSFKKSVVMATPSVFKKEKKPFGKLHRGVQTLHQKEESHDSGISVIADLEAQATRVTPTTKHDRSPGFDSDDETLSPDSNSKVRSPREVKNIFRSAALAIGKLKRGSRPKFNFDKYLSYLDSMRPVVGYTIGGIMVTWDLVSTILFLLFSLVAVFVQESIFGSQKSTIK